MVQSCAGTRGGDPPWLRSLRLRCPERVNFSFFRDFPFFGDFPVFAVFPFFSGFWEFPGLGRKVRGSTGMLGEVQGFYGDLWVNALRDD